jgi:hypothetical protein
MSSSGIVEPPAIIILLILRHQFFQACNAESQGGSLMAFLRTLIALFVGGLLTSVGDRPALGQQSQSKIELDTLLRMYMTSEAKANYALSWGTGSEAGTPISWQHAGIEECAPELEKELGTAFCRTGKVVITIRGKPAYSFLGRTVKPGDWKIVLAGPHAGVSDVILESNVSSQELVPGWLKQAASKSGSAITVREIGKCGDAGTGAEQLSVGAKGKVTASALESWSCGSGGCSIRLILGAVSWSPEIC